MNTTHVLDVLLRKAQEAANRPDLRAAIQTATAAARRAPDRADVWRFLAGLHFRAGDYARAGEALRASMRLDPGQPSLFHDLGVALKLEGRVGEAEAMLREALRRAPASATATSLGDLLGSLGRAEEAEALYRAALERDPRSHDLMRELTNLQIKAGRCPQALDDLGRFMARNGQTVDALEQASVVLQCMDRLDEALEITSATIAARPPATLDIRLASYTSIAGRLARLEHRRRARTLIDSALDASLPADEPESWRRNDSNALRRFSFLMPYYGVEDRRLMRVFGAIGRGIAARTPALPAAAHQPSEPPRVGFVSYNFSEHPIGHLLSPFFEAHAQTGAELYLYALHLNGHDPNDYAGRIRATTPHYRDCRGTSASGLAKRVRADNVSILIDLDGYLGGGMPEAFAMRPAPVQIHWLQHLAGMPAPFIDYTIVDRVLVPDDERDNGNGPLIRLPDAFQCGDRVALPDGAPPRAEHGLRDGTVVFCAFGNWLKIDDEAFAAWLDILEKVPDSILWLSDGPSARSREMLRDLLAERGLDRDRIVFAPRLASKAAHLARHRCADIFLDTFAFSAATTTTDALWAGLPVLTRPGATAQSRLSASLMRAVGFEDTIVASRDEYIATAVRLAGDRDALARLKDKLAAALPDSALYDANRMVRSFRQIYAKVWARYMSGAPPAHIDIEAS